MKKIKTKVTQDDRQTRSTIPRVFVTELDITKNDEVEWALRRGKLKGELKKNE